MRQPGPEQRPDTYGEAFADVYDDWYGEITDAEETARFVAERCGGLPVLELGVGTGRLAEPMARLGLTVVGLDASSSMLERCAARRVPNLRLVQADMAAIPLSGRFGAALIAFNTLFNLQTNEAQGSLFAQLRTVMAPGGVVIIEAFDAAELADAEARSIGVGRCDPESVTIVGTVIDQAAQTIVGRHVEIDSGGVRVRPWSLRWATPAQIDELAVAAGFELAERYAYWDLSRHSPSSETHISCYKAGT